eukprot:jgi/Astpho2/9871/Aster-08331
MQAISTAERAQQGALQQAVQSGESNGNGSGAPQRMDDPLLVDPESFTLQPGELCTFSNGAGIHPEDGSAGCAQMQWRNQPGGYLKEILTARVYDVAVQTPLEEAVRLSEEIGTTMLLKREDMQPVRALGPGNVTPVLEACLQYRLGSARLHASLVLGIDVPPKAAGLMVMTAPWAQVFSFKLRGAYNKMASLTPEQRAKGVICSSAGNHAQGVALAAGHLGCKAIICMPVTTPEIKINAVRKMGGTVELVGESYSETQLHAQGRALRDGLVFVAPYDDPYTIAGQGTIGTEILRQLTTLQDDNLHAIFVAIGGGGLIAGIGAYVKALKPHVKIIGVEPTGANAMALSLVRGRRVTLSKVDAFADGVAVKQVGQETFRLCQQVVDGLVLVDNRAVSAAIKVGAIAIMLPETAHDVFNETRSILEPAGAVAVAGAKAYLKHHNIQGKTVVAVTSGANMNFDRLRLVSELADIGASREAMLAVTIPEQPGAFRAFVDAALGDTDIQVTEFKYRYSAGQEAHILFSVSVRAEGEAEELMQRLKSSSMPTINLSNIEAAQVHLRHLVGGRARSFTGELPHERIIQVDFPERPGALRKLLAALDPEWNVTLFHYRKTGNRSSQGLLGLQIPPRGMAALQRVTEGLAPDFSFTELAGEARQVFNMFIS